ncbi:TVP38/TMEM64 family protein [Sulfurospirillum arcachonense]|uniref:TVP38/TMEM64 family protein n=1 Tax=Sulfurospirillum arcachonense TaxID=57666 RepID=UPI000467F508|nr:TVP38/TMEM64 family protein [Sulfurospirillum arcachonense]
MLKKVLFFIVLFLVLGFFYYFDIFMFTSPVEIKEYVLSFGIYAPIIFIILFTIVPLTLFPDALLAIAGGLIFGLYEGSLYVMIGALCGATLSFYISRIYAAWIKKKLSNKKLINLDKNAKENGFLIIFFLRLVPLVPFDIISYSAGFSSIKYRDFILATCIGIIPGVVVYANIGAQSFDLGSNGFYIAVASLLALIVFSMMFKNKLEKRLYENN